MRALFLSFFSLLLISCGPGVKRISVTGRPPVTLALSEPAEADEDKEKDGEESPDEWVEFHLLRRTGGTPLPAEKLLEAKRHKDTMPVRFIGTRRPLPRLAESPRDANLGNWQALGPGNIGGRTRALAIRPDDPNTMYAGTEGGGIWKTTDGGASWNPLDDLLPSLAISSLAIDPKDPNTIYAGTGEWYTGATRGDSIRGAGIYKTTDGGATWTLLPKPIGGNAFDYTNKVVVSPNDSQHIYTVNWVGVYYSPDGGNTWQLQLNRSGSMEGCQDLVIRSDQATDYLFAACAYGGSVNPALYRNVDAAGSGTWQVIFSAQDQPDMARTSLALAPSNQSIVYAAVSTKETGDYLNGILGVFRSTSNGDPGSWTMQASRQDANYVNSVLFTNPRGAFTDICSGGKKTFSNQGWYDNVIAVDPLNPDVVWVGGIDLFRSDDGGQNFGIAAFWELENGEPQGAHADNHAIVFHPGYNGADNQTLFVSSDGGVFRTDNALAATATGDRAGCSPYTTNVVWHNLDNGYAATQFYQGSVYPGGGAYLGGSQDNNMSRGSDATGANAWTSPIHIGDGGFSAIDPADPNIWYILGTHLAIDKTTNGGASFSSMVKGITEDSTNFLFIAPLAMDPGNPKLLYTGGKTLWRTPDGAANWSAASSALAASAGSISAIAVSPIDSDHVVFGTSTGFVFHSTAATTTDNTVAWASSQPRPGFVSSVTLDPTEATIVYATYSQYKQNAAQSHVYKSTDGGATWTGIDGSGATGLPDVPVFALIIDPQNTSSFYLGTDIGLFVSTDGGATWSRDSNPFADAVTEVLVLDRSSGQNTLFAFTHGRGVWRTVLPGSGDPCQYSVNANSVEFPAYGSNATFTVTTGDHCAWSVFPTGTDFTTIPATGTGNGKFVVNGRFLNNTAQPFTSQVQVQNQLISVTQDAARTAAGNDNSAAAFPFGTLPSVVIQNTSGATESAADPVHSCTHSADSKTVWFSLTTPKAGKVTMNFLATQPNGADAGLVLSLYRVVNGQPGAEFGCYVTPQTKSGNHTQAINWNASAGDNYLVEASATISGAPAGSVATGGNLSIWVNLQ